MTRIFILLVILASTLFSCSSHKEEEAGGWNLQYNADSSKILMDQSLAEFMLMQVHEIQGTLDTGFYRSRDSKAWSFDFPIDTSNSEYMAYFPYGDESYAFWAGEDMALERETYVGAEILRNRPDTCDSQQFDAVIRQDSTGRVIDGEFSIVDYNSCTKAYTPWPNDGNAVNRMNTILVTMWNLSRTPIDSARFSASDQAKGR